MTTRRDFLRMSGAVAAALVARYGAAAEPSTLLPAQPRAKLAFEVPSGACDTHVHIVGDRARYPFVAKRAYTPPEASVDQLRALHRTLDIDRVVVVQPSFYGTDNSCTMDAVRSLGSGARAIVVIDEKTPEADLDYMQRYGARGVRLNLATAGVTDPAASGRFLRSAVERIRPRGWHVQLNTEPKIIGALKAEFAALPVPVVFDHFGGGRAAQNVNAPGFDALLELVRSGKAYVKISATELYSTEPPGFAGYAAMAQALIAANPDRILWGTNWPHPTARPPGYDPSQLLPWRDIDDVVVMNLLPVWAPDPAVRKKILVDNPARLFGY